MDITVRLYRQHDMDLITMYRTKGFRFQKEMKAAVTAWANGSEYHIRRPEGAVMKAGYVPTVIQMHITLDKKIDSACIKKLRDIRYGYRSSFLKGLFRQYMTAEPLEGYFNRDDLIFDAEKDYIEKKRPKKKKHHGVRPEEIKVKKFRAEEVTPDDRTASKAVSDDGEQLYAAEERTDRKRQHDREETPTEYSTEGYSAAVKESAPEVPDDAPESIEKTAETSRRSDTASPVPDLFGGSGSETDSDEDYEELMKAMSAIAH